MDIKQSHSYTEFLQEINSRIRQAQEIALRSVNKEMILLYWDIGRRIVDKQKGDGWGNSIIENLALDLQRAFPGMKGFSSRNLRYMRDFYVSYSDNEKLQTLSAEISWSHNIAILEKSKDALEREFYIRMSRKYHWSYRALLNHIENQTYEKTLLGQTNFDVTLPAQMQEASALVVKDEYTFDFLELGDDFSERQLENALVARV